MQFDSGITYEVVSWVLALINIVGFYQQLYYFKDIHVEQGLNLCCLSIPNGRSSVVLKKKGKKNPETNPPQTFSMYVGNFYQLLQPHYLYIFMLTANTDTGKKK